jgi:hypothetical protein
MTEKPVFQAEGSMSAYSTLPGRIGLYITSLVTGAILLCFSFLIDNARSEGDAGPWKEVETGLLIGEFEPKHKVGTGDSAILVVKVDPQRFAFKLMTASENGGRKLSVKEWCERYQLVAAFNAGMYQEDGLTSVGYMKNFKRINNGRLNRNNAVLAFNPVDSGVPEIQIIDRECQDFESLKGKYQTLVQSIRMVSCEQQNVWSPQATGWSTLAIGMDKNDRVLLIFSQEQYSVHDLVEILLSLPISLYNAMYLEGGPQASVYLSTQNATIEKHGSWEGPSVGHNSIQMSLPIPNVIGIVRK